MTASPIPSLFSCSLRGALLAVVLLSSKAVLLEEKRQTEWVKLDELGVMIRANQQGTATFKEIGQAMFRAQPGADAASVRKAIRGFDWQSLGSFLGLVMRSKSPSVWGCYLRATNELGPEPMNEYDRYTKRMFFAKARTHLDVPKGIDPADWAYTMEPYLRPVVQEIHNGRSSPIVMFKLDTDAAAAGVPLTKWDLLDKKAQAKLGGNQDNMIPEDNRKIALFIKEKKRKKSLPPVEERQTLPVADQRPGPSSEKQIPPPHPPDSR